jgi:predicted ATPase
MIHRQTQGNPLFVSSVLTDLAGRGVLAEDDGRWRTTCDADAIDLGIPDDVRRTIERQLDRLPTTDRLVLDVASVVGVAFTAASVAAGARLPESDVEHVLANLTRRLGLVRDTGSRVWPDGTVTAHAEFAHSLYRDVLYERLPAGRRAELHRRVGTRQEAAYGDRAPEIAAELSLHFEQCRDLRCAAAYRQHAAENAKRRHALTEARLHFERALALVEADTPGADRTEREVVLRIGLGGVIMATRGWGASEAEEAFSRAREQCRTLGETPRLFPALWGLWLFYWGRGPLDAAHALARDLLALARTQDDAALLLQAHHASWATEFSLGNLDAAHASAREGIRLYDTARHAEMAATFGNHDAGACARMFGARALALLGREDEAVRMADEAIALARDLGHPFSLALALVFAAAVHEALGDAGLTLHHAGAAAALAREQEFGLILAWASALEGWALVERGDADEGVRRIAEAASRARAAGSNQFVPHLLGLLAAARMKTGQHEEGMTMVEAALAVAGQTGERFHEAELHRLRGELWLAAAGPTAVPDARRAFTEAVDIGRRQGARLLVRRAEASLARLGPARGDCASAARRGV